MVINGWAWVLARYGPNERYSLALADAQRNRRGIWARDDNIHPWELKKTRYGERQRVGSQPSREPTLFDRAASIETRQAEDRTSGVQGSRSSVRVDRGVG